MNSPPPLVDEGVMIDQEFEKLSPESKAQVLRAMRNYERRERREQATWDRGRGMYLTDEDRYGE